MDQKQAEKIDVERCKELFEYEMTEVILMLKGEFATVSGKQMGLSQYQISEKNWTATKETITQMSIPTVEIQQVGPPDDLTEKIIPVIETIRSIVSTNQNTPQCTAAITLDIPSPTKKSLTYPHGFPLSQVEPPSQFAIPDTTRVQVPQNLCVQYTAPQIELPSVKDVPRTDVQTACEMPEHFNIPSVPHFCVKGPSTECEPVAVEVPDVKIFAQMEQKVMCGHSAGNDCECVRQISQPVTIPKVPATAIPKVTYSGTSISIPKISKAPVPNLPQAHTGISTDGAVPAVMAGMKRIHADFSHMSFVPVPKNRTKEETGTAVNQLIPVKCVAVKTAFAEIPVSKQPGDVPDIPHFCTLQSRKFDGMRRIENIPLPVMPDIQQEVKCMLTIAYV